MVDSPESVRDLGDRLRQDTLFLLGENTACELLQDGLNPSDFQEWRDLAQGIDEALQIITELLNLEQWLTSGFIPTELIAQNHQGLEGRPWDQENDRRAPTITSDRKNVRSKAFFHEWGFPFTAALPNLNPFPHHSLDPSLNHTPATHTTPFAKKHSERSFERNSKTPGESLLKANTAQIFSETPSGEQGSTEQIPAVMLAQRSITAQQNDRLQAVKQQQLVKRTSAITQPAARFQSATTGPQTETNNEEHYSPIFFLKKEVKKGATVDNGQPITASTEIREVNRDRPIAPLTAIESNINHDVVQSSDRTQFQVPEFKGLHDLAQLLKTDSSSLLNHLTDSQIPNLDGAIHPSALSTDPTTVDDWTANPSEQTLLTPPEADFPTDFPADFPTDRPTDFPTDFPTADRYSPEQLQWFGEVASSNLQPEQSPVSVQPKPSWQQPSQQRTVQRTVQPEHADEQLSRIASSMSTTAQDHDSQQQTDRWPDTDIQALGEANQIPTGLNLDGLELEQVIDAIAREVAREYRYFYGD